MRLSLFSSAGTAWAHIPTATAKAKRAKTQAQVQKNAITPQEFSELNRKTASHAQARDICRVRVTNSHHCTASFDHNFPCSFDGFSIING
jgi:hypothetical protein